MPSVELRSIRQMKQGKNKQFDLKLSQNLFNKKLPNLSYVNSNNNSTNSDTVDIDNHYNEN